MKNVTKLWCEWDFGQDGYIFTDPDKAKAWFNSNENVLEHYAFEQEEGLALKDETPFDFYYEQGLVSCEILTLDP